MRVVQMVEGAMVAPYILDVGTNCLEIAGVVVDLAAAEADSQTILNITNDAGTPVLGLGGKNGYIADIEVPPRRYERVEEEDADGILITKSIAIPFDVNAVVLKLWPYPAEGTIKKEE